jgi:hypothetical protein
VGYGRLEGIAATKTLGRLHELARLYVNFFQPSFKLQSKVRAGAKVTKKYDRPATPYSRILASNRVTDQCKEQLTKIFCTLDPLRLLHQIRRKQRNLACHQNLSETGAVAETSQELARFIASLSTAWLEGEVRPTHLRKVVGPRAWRTRADPFEEVWPTVERWLNEEPDATAKMLFQKLQSERPACFTKGQLRTLQRRVKEWRTAIARHLVFGIAGDLEPGPI